VEDSHPHFLTRMIIFAVMEFVTFLSVRLVD